MPPTNAGANSLFGYYFSATWLSVSSFDSADVTLESEKIPAASCIQELLSLAILNRELKWNLQYLYAR